MKSAYLNTSHVVIDPQEDVELRLWLYNHAGADIVSGTNESGSQVWSLTEQAYDDIVVRFNPYGNSGVFLDLDKNNGVPLASTPGKGV